MYSRILRFAPSPNGYLHLGHAYSALLNHDMAREFGGRCCCASRTSTLSAAARNTRRRSTRICAGSAFPGIEPVRRQSEHFDDYTAALSPSSKRRGCFIRASKAAARSTPWSPSSTATATGRAIRTACRSIRAGRASSPPPSAARRRAAGEPFALRLAMDARGGARRRADLDRNRRRAAAARPASSPPRRRCGATSCWRARKCRPAITSPPFSTMRCRASPTWCAGRICSGRPASIGCCRCCSACRSRPIITTSSSSTMTAASCRNRPRRRVCANCAPPAQAPRDIRRMVGLGR